MSRDDLLWVAALAAALGVACAMTNVFRALA